MADYIGKASRQGDEHRANVIELLLNARSDIGHPYYEASVGTLLMQGRRLNLALPFLRGAYEHYCQQSGRYSEMTLQIALYLAQAYLHLEMHEEAEPLYYD